MQEIQDIRVQSLNQENPLEKEMATHSIILIWKIPWTEEPGGLQSTESQRIWLDWAHMHAMPIKENRVETSLFVYYPLDPRDPYINQLSQKIRGFFLSRLIIRSYLFLAKRIRRTDSLYHAKIHTLNCSISIKYLSSFFAFLFLCVASHFYRWNRDQIMVKNTALNVRWWDWVVISVLFVNMRCVIKN